MLLLLLAGSALSLGMVGYSAGLRERRSVITAVVLVVALGAVLMLVVDLDRPQEGLINVSQQAILDVQGVGRAAIPLIAQGRPHGQKPSSSGRKTSRRKDDEDGTLDAGRAQVATRRHSACT